LPAKYLDPMTQLPYKNVQTFRLLREALNGDRKIMVILRETLFV